MSTWPRIVFEDLFGVGQHLPALSPDNARGKRFNRNEGTYKNCWDRDIAPRLRAAGVERFWRHFDRLASVLPNWFAWREEGQHLPSALLFASNDPHAQTHRYYTTWQRAELADHYHQELERLASALGYAPREHEAPGQLFDYRSPSTTISESWVGNDRMPLAESVTALVGRLQEEIAAVRKRSLETPEWLPFHNAVTAHTALGLALATGARAVRTPIPDLTARHTPTGTLALQEKDRADGAHARLVVLPAVVLEQIEHYLNHLVTLFTAFPGLPLTLTCRSTKQRDRSAYSTATFQLDLRKTLFFLAAESGDDGSAASWRPIELTGQTLGTHLDQLLDGYWPFGNAGRHFLRSYLTRQDCPATLINTHLGHWRYGEEPWASTSALDPVRYRQAIQPYLEQLMSDIGYRSLAP